MEILRKRGAGGQSGQMNTLKICWQQLQAVIDLTAAIEADGTQTLYLSNRAPGSQSVHCRGGRFMGRC